MDSKHPTATRKEDLLASVVVFPVALVDLLTGIAVGIVPALARLLHAFSPLEITVEEKKHTFPGGARAPIQAVGETGVEPFQRGAGAAVPEYVAVGIVVRLRGAATFTRLPQLAAVLEKVRPNAHVYVDLHELTFIDHAGLDLLVDWEQQHKAAGGELVLDWENLRGIFQRNAWRGQSRELPSTSRPAGMAARQQ